ncbi:hypothetical protein [Pontibacter chinhatensis]|uniref:Uncharacterized protein n=1 Tax=Pontibacter chinhatensis TaxID=1436961 RepID=A0A1I2QT20_9BACT|nr:hypothetical protein [Pontibacter chinhatensis]SFG31572.1 hypothetical protein SAMN05421739_102131 [Pontibacter chinhatensis]
MEKKYQDLEIDEDLELERRTWTVQRISWVLLLLIILAALLGFTGRGGLLDVGKGVAFNSSHSVDLEYERFLRQGVTREIKVSLRQENTSILFSNGFYETQRIEQVVPEPQKEEVGSEGITYTFHGVKSPSLIIFYVTPLKAGSLNYTVTGSDKEPVAVTQFVYP